MTHSIDTLRTAYEATSYRVLDSPIGPFTLRCGAVSRPLDNLLEHARVMMWAFVSAANPGSIRLDDGENGRRHAALVAEVRRRGLAHHDGVGVGDDGSWPGEESLLVLGLDEPAAVALGRAFGQSAVVVGERGRPARLVWITPPALPKQPP